MSAALRERPPAAPTSVRGLLWTVVLATDFYLLSNPLVFEPLFDESLRRAVLLTVAAFVVTLPWCRLPSVPWTVVAFLAWAASSLMWSINPDATESAWWLYAKIAVLALLAAGHVGPPVMAQGLALGGVFIVVASVYAFERGMPGTSYATGLGVIFTGVGTNQNILAYTLVLALAGALSWQVQRRSWVIAPLAATLVIFYGIARAGSATGYMTAVCVVLVRIVIPVASRLFRRSRRLGMISLAATGLAALAASLFVDAALGKESSTFSGRLPFWESTLRVWGEGDAPLLGFGWGAVWQHPWHPAPLNDVVEKIYAGAGYPLTHGHNNFIDVLPELGLVGVLLAVLMFLHMGDRALSMRTVSGTHDRQGMTLVVLSAVALLVFGITEPLLTIPLGWWQLSLILSLPPQAVAHSQRSRLKYRAEPSPGRVDPRASSLESNWPDEAAVRDKNPPA